MTADSGAARVVGLLHPGEMGAFIGSAIRGAGNRVVWASDGRSAATAARASDFEDVENLAALVATADTIVSVCPPASALDVAETVAAHGFAGLYVDCNAVSPATVTSVAAALSAATVVDGGIIGGPSTDDAVLHLSGEGAPDAADLFGPRVLRVDVLDGPVGMASALKACYAASSKAVTATLLAVRAAAAEAGVEDALLAEWERTQPGVVERSDATLRQIHRKAWRFGGEMREAADFFAAIGVPDGFSRAAAQTFDRLARLRDAPPKEPHDVLGHIVRPPEVGPG